MGCRSFTTCESRCEGNICSTDQIKQVGLVGRVVGCVLRRKLHSSWTATWAHAHSMWVELAYNKPQSSTRLHQISTCLEHVVGHLGALAQQLGHRLCLVHSRHLQERTRFASHEQFEQLWAPPHAFNQSRAMSQRPCSSAGTGAAYASQAEACLNRRSSNPPPRS